MSLNGGIACRGLACNAPTRNLVGVHANSLIIFLFMGFISFCPNALIVDHLHRIKILFKFALYNTDYCHEVFFLPDRRHRQRPGLSSKSIS
jgi:hypothetical protein